MLKQNKDQFFFRPTWHQIEITVSLRRDGEFYVIIKDGG